jgi:hypothetical protein
MTHIAQNMEYLSNPVRFNKIDTTARDALTSQAEGNMIYNTTTDQVEIYNGSGWENLITSVTGESTIDGDVTIDNRNRLRLADAGVDKALIGLNQGKYLYMGSEGTNSDPRIRFDGEATQAAIVPTLPAGATTSGASGYLNLGSTTSAFKEIHLTDGVVFPDAGSTGTSTSNTLDSYEEGTWTPTLNFGGGSTGIAYTTQSGSYVKIGQIVTVQFRIELSSKGTSTGDANFGGLPFTATSVGTLYPAFYGLHHDVNSGSGNTTASVLPIGQIGRANTTWKYYSADSVTPVTDAYFNNNTVINGTVTFRVD